MLPDGRPASACASARGHCGGQDAARALTATHATAGSSRVRLQDGVRTTIQAGFAVLVPAGTRHNIVNTGSVALKLYTLHAPPNHRDGVVHHTRDDAQVDNEHFDGKTTE